MDKLTNSRGRSFRFLLCLLSTCPLHAGEGAQGLTIVTVDSVSCIPLRNQAPCFRAVVSTGSPVDAAFFTKLQVLGNDQAMQLFYAEAAGDDSASQMRRKRVSLILLDVSGSMLSGKRFPAAKNAAMKYVGTAFDERLDEIAVIPFASKQVIAGVRDAAFSSTREGVLKQISGIPAPSATDNTGLFGAIQTALVKLQDKKKLEQTVRVPGTECGLIGGKDRGPLHWLDSSRGASASTCQDRDNQRPTGTLYRIPRKAGGSRLPPTCFLVVSCHYRR